MPKNIEGKSAAVEVDCLCQELIKSQRVKYLNKPLFQVHMDIKILEEKKNRMSFELKGMGHSFCNALKHELSQDDHVKTATYTIDHPLLNVPKILIETDGAEPRKVLISAAQRLGKNLERFKELASQELK